MIGCLSTVAIVSGGLQKGGVSQAASLFIPYHLSHPYHPLPHPSAPILKSHYNPRTHFVIIRLCRLARGGCQCLERAKLVSISCSVRGWALDTLQCLSAKTLGSDNHMGNGHDQHSHSPHRVLAYRPVHGWVDGTVNNSQID